MQLFEERDENELHGPTLNYDEHVSKRAQEPVEEKSISLPRVS